MNSCLALGLKIRRVLVLAAVLGVVGCAQATDTILSSSDSSTDSTSLFPAPVAVSDQTPNDSFSLPKAVTPVAAGSEQYGSGQTIAPPIVPVTAPAHDGGLSEQDGGITFNFVDADVTAVAHTIFGQLLKENYTVDGGVQGKITLQTTRPLSRDEVLPALETSLRMANLALVHEADGYHIAPFANAAQDAGGNLSVAGGSQTPGYGYEIIPLKYANAAAVEKLVQPLAQSGVQIQIDTTRNLLIVAGTSQDRAAIAANVAVFDVDWLAGMSYAFIPMQNASAQSVAKEVGELINGEDSPMSGLVRLVVVNQLNAILVITQQQRYLAEIRAWITRFDQQAQTTERQVFVYHVQNGRAQDIANVLNQLLGQPSNAAENSTSGSQPTTSAGSDTGSSDQSSPAAALLAPTLGSQQGGMQPNLNATNDNQETGYQGGQDTTTGDLPPRITADDTNNALLIYATSDQYRSLLNALAQLDVQPQQVMIEAAVAEVDLTSQLEYGVQYAFRSGRVQSINTQATTAALSEILPGFSAILNPSQNIQIMLNALQSITHVNVISAPKLLVLNNQPAVLQVGDEVPITTQTAQSTDTSNAPLVSTIQYQNTGVILHVTPRINEGGLVTLDISQEVSEVSTTTSSTLNSPTISERKISTVVAVPDGQTVALGGLIQSNATADNGGIPILSQIPALSFLFSNHNTSGSRTELLVLITPHVVQSASSLEAVTAAVRNELPTIRASF